MLMLNPLVGFGVGGDGGGLKARYWRLRTVSTFSGEWVTKGGDVSASADLSGADLAASLTVGTSLDLQNASGAVSTSPTGNDNVFGGTGELSAPDGEAQRMWFDFGVPVSIGSIRTNHLAASRRPPSLYLEYSDDNSAWTTYATLNAGSVTSPYWRNIVEGGVIAATSS